MRETEVKVNDVTIKIKRMSAKTQHDLINKFVVPVLAGGDKIEIGDLENADKVKIFSAIFKAIDSRIPPDSRNELLFSYLLNPDHVKVSVQGIEVPFCQNGDIQCESLDSVKYLYQIAIHVLKFNFEDFFSDWGGAINLTSLN